MTTGAKMFCYQCEQTSKGEGCTQIGVCGKQPDVAALQDLLVYALKGLSLYAIEGKKRGVTDAEVNRFTAEALFSTLTNVDFDPDRFEALIRECADIRERLKAKVRAAGGNIDFQDAAAGFKPEPTRDGYGHSGEISRHQVRPIRQSGHTVSAADSHIRVERSCRLCRPCTDTRTGR